MNHTLKSSAEFWQTSQTITDFDYNKMEKSLFQSKIDKHRFHGSHGKFMVTEKAGYIGTSNWAEDYFTDTAGRVLK